MRQHRNVDDGRLALTRREVEVIRLLARGLTNRELAARLHISIRTAEFHRASIRRKLSLASRAELVDYVDRNGLLE
jgi:two-component system response regulator NreC